MASSVTNNQIFTELTKVSVAVARVEGRIKNVEDASADLMTVVIKGNGKLPLTERVKKLEDRNDTEDADKKAADDMADAVKKEVKAKREKWGTRTWGIIAAILTYLIIQSIAFMNLFERIASIK